MTPTARVERARELFALALALPPGARDDLLDRECAGDPDLRRDVAELLALDAADTPAEPAPGAASAPAPAPPDRIGDFRILREIGRGGMGVVYEAEQGSIPRRVALKVINPGLLGPGALRRFQRESRALGALAHPGIVRLFEAGAEPTPGAAPRPYLAMELVEGESLRRCAQARRPGVAEILGLVAPLCDAVHHAHQKGIVHRDLKPDNVLVVPPDDEATRATGDGPPRPLPKILDFGVSRLLEDDAAATLSTRVGQIVGTVPYLSPEQARGDAHGADTRSDVYALGVIAFELLAGGPPFDVHALPVADALRVVVTTEPVRLRALARAPSWTYIGGRFVRRHRALTGVVAASALLIAASVVAMALAWADARRTREAAVWQRYLSAMSAASVALAGGDLATARRALESTPPEHRGWEFAHLSSRLDQSQRCVRPPFRPPFAATPVPGLGLVLTNDAAAARLVLDPAAPGGASLAVVGEGSTIDLLDARTLRTLGNSRGHTREVLAMVFSPDASRLFSADFAGVIRVWDTRTFDEVAQLRGHTENVRRLAITRDGKCLVSGSRDGTSRVWTAP